MPFIFYEKRCCFSQALSLSSLGSISSMAGLISFSLQIMVGVRVREQENKNSGIIPDSSSSSPNLSLFFSLCLLLVRAPFFLTRPTFSQKMSRNLFLYLFMNTSFWPKKTKKKTIWKYFFGKKVGRVSIFHLFLLLLKSLGCLLVCSAQPSVLSVPNAAYPTRFLNQV